MSDCIHCQIHDLLESHLQNPEANVADIAFKVTEALADLILMASPENQGMLIADIVKRRLISARTSAPGLRGSLGSTGLRSTAPPRPVRAGDRKEGQSRR